jgi:predicted CXXCH cytochrome family protein
MEKTRSKLYSKEVKKMRKALITMFVALLSLVLVYGYADAQVAGQCSGCHTMHNSQNGTDMAKDFDGVATATANKNLTVSSCLGCHNGVASGAPDIFQAYVSSSAAVDAGTYGTAGGSFLDTVFNDDARGHNVQDLKTVYPSGPGDEGMTSTPGNSGSNITLTPTELTCAGAKGCHGDHDAGKTTSEDGIKGFHHAAAPGFRFLQLADDTKITGKGSADWEQGGADATNHNVYSASDTGSISELCAECHGQFHGTGNTGTGSPWIRHPTENDLPSAWDSVGNGIKVEYNRNPFAFDPDDWSLVLTTSAYDYDDGGVAQVACISCHRAHASDVDDLLRFKYTDMTAGGSKEFGCLGCHSGQR